MKYRERQSRRIYYRTMAVVHSLYDADGGTCSLHNSLTNVMFLHVKNKNKNVMLVGHSVNKFIQRREKNPINSTRISEYISRRNMHVILEINNVFLYFHLTYITQHSLHSKKNVILSLRLVKLS